MPRNYYVNEGTHIGGQEGQPRGTQVMKITAADKISKGGVVEITDNWKVKTAADKSSAVVGIAFNDAELDTPVVVETEGFVKLDATNLPITAGNKLVSGGSGKVRAYVAANDTDATIIGIAFNSCSANGIVYTKLAL